MTRQLCVVMCFGALLVIAASALPSPRAVSAEPAAPHATYWVTSSSNSAITTCAGAAGDCSLRGAVQLANASAGADTIYISTSVTSIILSTPITLTGGSITIQGNGSEVTNLETNGNFPAIVVTSNNNFITKLWISASGLNNHAGSNQHGVVITGNANTVSDSSLSDLGGNGVLITNGTDNWIYSNRIGVQTAGGSPWVGCNFTNDQWGVRLVGASRNSLLSNTIGCSGQDGVQITGATSVSNTVAGYIGVFAAGGAVPNTHSGVSITGGAHGNVIGSGSLIGANKVYGVLIQGSGTDNNVVQLNSIGINGTTNISNTYAGIVIEGGAKFNQVLTNTIAYNAGQGILLVDAGTSSNQLRANLILSNTADGVALRSGASDNYVRSNTIRQNGNAGVLIDGGANSNRIGEYGNRAYGNIIGANATDGVYIGGATTRYNAVLGNLIGVTAAGNVADPNLHTGIALDAGTYGNIIGEYATERNVIAGNAWDGVLMINGAHDNYVWGNDIGTNRDFPAAGQHPDRPTGGGGEYIQLPNGGGVNLTGSYSNTIGGSIGATPVDNFISYNTHTGVYIAYGSQHNVIGSNLVRANAHYGVLLDGNNTGYNTISRTQILENGLDGIGERNNASFNVWTEVSVSNNGGLGIDKSANNDGQNIVAEPHNFGFDSINRTTGVVHGHADASVLGTVKIELYRVAPDPSGFGEGSIFIGSDITDGSGNWMITDPSPSQSGGCYTAFVTESQLVIPFSSSEFSANTCRTFLPLTVKSP